MLQYSTKKIEEIFLFVINNSINYRKSKYIGLKCEQISIVFFKKATPWQVIFQRVLIIQYIEINEKLHAI